jgi:ABC-type transporter Mla subunit MlaD
MSNELPPDEADSLLKFIASTVEHTNDRLGTLSERFDSLSGRFDSLSQSVATKDELRTQTAAIRGDIEQVQLRLDSIERSLSARMGQIEADLSRLRSAVYLLSKERPEVLRLLGQ